MNKKKKTALFLSQQKKVKLKVDILFLEKILIKYGSLTITIPTKLKMGKN